MKCVLKIGGHILFSELNADKIRIYAEAIRKIVEEDVKLIVVVGGGKKAREYIEVARKLGADNFGADIIGIEVTRLNAMLLSLALAEKAFFPVPVDIKEILQLVAQKNEKVIITGGLIPGQSTVGVATLIAEAINADLLIIATDVNGVYTADPKKDPNAKLLEEIHIDQLIQMMSKTKVEAGTYKLFDLMSLKIMKRSRIKTVVVNGNKIENIFKAIKGKKCGTIITF